MAGRDSLSEQIHLLGDLLGQTIVEQEGPALFALVEDVRALAKAHRGGDAAAGERLLARVRALPLAEARGVVKAFASYFQLVKPVFTAHPPEAKRRTILIKLGRIADTLHALRVPLAYTR